MGADHGVERKAMEKPKTINILGLVYEVEYVDKPSDVDIFRRESLWGQIDFWTRTIRIYDNGRGNEDLWHTIMHEVLHGIASAMKLKTLTGSEHEDELDLLALALVDVLFRNGWMPCPTLTTA